MASQKFRELFLIDISGEVSSNSINAVPLLINSIDEVQKTFLLSVLSTLVDGQKEKLHIKVARVSCNDPKGASIHECIKGAKFEVYKVIDAKTFKKIT